MASTPTAPPVQLRSPFNGEVWTVPPDQSPAFIQALVDRGFTRVETESAKPTRKPTKEPAHG